MRSGQFDEGFTAAHRLNLGTDGAEPQAGAPNQAGTFAAAFDQLLALEDVSIVAAPGHSAFATANYQAIQGLLRSHVERPRAYRIGVLDTPDNLTPSLARQERARVDSTRLTLYFPWVTVANPLARPGRDDIPREIKLPPSGFICGIYARNDVFQSVSKAPANEVVNSALRFERDINHAENQLLNPLGVNCLRYFPGRGYRVWGARLTSSDPEWKYVNVRRYFLYLEASIDRGTQWAVFENNGPRLWANIRETVEAFLYNEWVSGNLLGTTPKEAFFVRCDRSTMTQNDLDNGRLICLIGVAVLKPAEFVIFRIGQKTADERS
jgi:phage tail sheath protein FI